MAQDDQDYTPYSLQDDDEAPAQQLAALVSPSDAASLLPPDLSASNSAPPSSTPAGVMPASAPAQPSAVAAPASMPAAIGSGRAALASIGPPPQLDLGKMQQLQQQRGTDATPINPYSAQYKPGVGLRIRRAAAALLTGGIPGLVTQNYSGPTRQYGIDEQQRQARLGQDTAQIGDLEKNYEDSVKGYQQGVNYARQQNTADRNSNTLQTALAKGGFKQITDDQGNTSVVEDPDSEAFKSRKVMDDLRQSTQDLRDAQTAVEKAKNDPNSPAFKQAQQRLAVLQQGHDAAMLRAQAYMGNYQMHAKGVDLQGNVLPGATELPDNTPVGTAFQGTVQKQQPKVAMFNDVFGSLDSLDNAARKLQQSGGSIHSPRIAAAMADPQGTSTQYLQGLVAKGQLTPQERDYVINNAAAHENLMALRSSVGGGVSDSQVHQLLSLLPNASTPDLDYALRQTGQIRATANRLGSGIANVHGGHRVQGSQPETSNGAPKQLDRATAQQYLQKAGGDPVKARKAAAQDGYKF